MKRYEIVIDGRTYTADSDADARALIERVLAGLQSAASRSV